VAVLNLDDPCGRRLASEISDERVRRVGCAIESDDAEVRAADIEVSDRGLKAGIAAPGVRLNVTSKLIGKHNLENILTATALALELGVDQRIIETGIEKLERVPGRLEPVENSGDITVLVDYAHTPDALEHAVKTCRSLAGKRLITVFGCGGDRDPGKRPLMGIVAVENSDLSVVTSDNPRTEDPMAIIGHILYGVRETGIVEIKKEKVAENPCPGPGYIVEPDRKSAIKLAIEAARPGDMVLIAGKGHEDYQILGDEKIHFDDREEAENALKEKAGK
jgi:UDP-N-acetylmuramoyl-L-alanyl-D-glutamate--2,6-diaminopimelate ligase